MNGGDGDRRIELSADELYAIHKRRLTRILDIAAANEEEALILGAFRCGAFRNDPNIVSAAAGDVVPHYRTRFKVIEFAVFCPPGNTRNYDAFKRTRDKSNIPDILAKV